MSPSTVTSGGRNRRGSPREVFASSFLSLRKFLAGRKQRRMVRRCLVSPTGPPSRHTEIFHRADPSDWIALAISSVTFVFFS